MAFDNPTNRGRVERVIETIDLVLASARSNRAPRSAAMLLLAPVIDKLATVASLPPDDLPAPVPKEPARPMPSPGPAEAGGWDGWAKIDAAIEAVSLGEPERARKLLLEVMSS
jgi:hypothetical protein